MYPSARLLFPDSPLKPTTTHPISQMFPSASYFSRASPLLSIKMQYNSSAIIFFFPAYWVCVLCLRVPSVCACVWKTSFSLLAVSFSFPLLFLILSYLSYYIPHHNYHNPFHLTQPRCMSSWTIQDDLCKHLVSSLQLQPITTTCIQKPIEQHVSPSNSIVSANSFRHHSNTKRSLRLVVLSFFLSTPPSPWNVKRVCHSHTFIHDDAQY